MNPFRSKAQSDHSAKLKRMTQDYGAADPAANIINPTSIMKGEGPEESVGFGANSTKSRPRGDRPARKAVANDVATLRKGGRVGDGGPTGSICRARGGRTKKGKGATHVTVVVAPQSGNQAPMGHNPPMMASPPMMPPKPPMVPPGAGPGGPPMPPGGGPPVIPPGMPPPGMMPPRASGGRVGTLADQGLDAPSSSREEPGISTKKGKVTGYDAGAISGEGRLEKIKNYGRKESHAKPQVV